ncbi:hypothetical protein Ddc_13808 [Ditylenchus destructor]|nr:hypothetical protein Ddc_13808 [Ditylenchus destructor]
MSENSENIGGSLKEAEPQMTTEAPPVPLEMPADTAPATSPPRKRKRVEEEGLEDEDVATDRAQSIHSESTQTSGSSDSDDGKEEEGYMNDPNYLQLWKAQYVEEGHTEEAAAVQNYMDFVDAAGDELSDEEGSLGTDDLPNEDEIPPDSESDNDDA